MAKVKLFCLPHAGGSSISYYPWRKYIGNYIELIPLEYKGRGRRVTEELSVSLDDMVTDLYENIRKELYIGRYAILGHSMGSIVAYELVRKIQFNKDPMPIHLFVSGSNPPRFKSKIASVYKESDERICEEIQKQGGTSQILFENDELLQLYIPIFKSDFRNLFEYRYHESKLNCNASVLGGLDDKEFEQNNVRCWKDYIAGNCMMNFFSGDHFYLFKDFSVVDYVNTVLKDYVEE